MSLYIHNICTYMDTDMQYRYIAVWLKLRIIKKKCTITWEIAHLSCLQMQLTCNLLQDHCNIEKTSSII